MQVPERRPTKRDSECATPKPPQLRFLDLLVKICRKTLEDDVHMCRYPEADRRSEIRNAPLPKPLCKDFWFVWLKFAVKLSETTSICSGTRRLTDDARLGLRDFKKSLQIFLVHLVNIFQKTLGDDVHMCRYPEADRRYEIWNARPQKPSVESEFQEKLRRWRSSAIRSSR